MLFPACTGLGVSVSVTVRSGPVVPTSVDTVAVLFAELGSITDELTFAVPVITVPFATPVFTLTTIENVAELNPAKSALVQTTLPPLPGFGVRQLHPEGVVDETKVVLAGTGTISVALSAALGPLSVATTVYVMFPPLATGSGDAASVTDMSAVEMTAAVSIAVSLVRSASPPPSMVAMFVNVAGADCETRAFRVMAG